MELPDTEHLILGMSPFNPHFSVNWLVTALRWGAERFSTVDVLHPGSAAVSLLPATGTPGGRARRKVRQQCNKDLRTVSTAVCKSGVRLGRGEPTLLSEHIGDRWYAGQRVQVEAEYHQNPNFRSTCLAMSEAAANSRLKVTDSSLRPDLDIAVSYVIDELPAYTHTAKLFGYSSAALSYPAPWPVGDCIRAGETSLTIDPDSHFFVLDPTSELNHA